MGEIHNPKELAGLSGSFNEAYGGIKQQDAHQHVSDLLDLLVDELKKQKLPHCLPLHVDVKSWVHCRNCAMFSEANSQKESVLSLPIPTKGIGTLQYCLDEFLDRESLKDEYKCPECKKYDGMN